MADLKPIGLLPKQYYEVQTDFKRFQAICGAISRYYNAGLPINPEWIIEYNELLIKHS